MARNDKLRSDVCPRLIHLALIFITFLAIIATFFIQIVATSISSIDVFGDRNLAVVWRDYDTHLTPPNWTYYIRYIVFIWLTLASIYTITQTCRRGIKDQLYRSPILFPWYFYLVLLLSLTIQVCAFYYFSERNFIPSFVCVLLLVITSYIDLCICFICLAKEKKNLSLNGFIHEPGMCVGFVHNGVGIIAAWASLVCLFQFVIMLHYSFDVTMETATTIALMLFAIGYLTWVISESIYLDCYTRWFVIPHIVVVWAFAGICIKNYEDAGPRNSVFMVVILAIAAFSLIYKFILSWFRECRRPSSSSMQTYQDHSGRIQVVSSPRDSDVYHSIVSRNHSATPGSSRQHKIFVTSSGQLYNI